MNAGEYPMCERCGCECEGGAGLCDSCQMVEDHSCKLCGATFEDDGFDTCESCDDSVELPEEDFSLAPHTCGGNDPYFCKKCDPKKSTK